MIEFMEGFESAQQAVGGHRFTSSNASGGIGTTYGRNGGRGWNMNNAFFDVPLTAARNDIYLGFAFNFAALSSSVPVRVYNGSTILSRFIQNTDGSMTYQRGNGTANMYTTPAGAMIAGTYRFYEFRWKGNVSAGVWEMRVNDIVVGTFAGQTTNSGDPTDTTMIELTLNGNIDDLYIVSAGTGGIVTYLGDGSLLPIRPSAAGSHADGVQTGGTAGQPWTAVNEVTPDDDTSYIMLPNVGDIHSFAHGALGATPSAIKAMQVINKVRLGTAGSGQAAGFVKSGATERAGGDAGASHGITSTYAPIADIYELDPNTGAAWTLANLNAAEIGVKKVA